ncbi:unnamed protein product [Mytilus edulis]|uniref:C2H2-type domain-containing protein n=1 Tax=Mytilus edulis TaxID=6550 RepID=A0A8S3RFG8_MYTED|nr:unnamed protein product [Mytilus edulis]
MKERMESAHSIVRKNTETAMRRQKKYHDLKLSWQKIEKDDEVYVYFLRTSCRIPRKHQGRFFYTSLRGKVSIPFCPVEFGNKEDRNRHLFECTDYRLFCELCSYNTNKRDNLTRHFKKVHCSTDNKDESENTESESDDKKQKPITKSIYSYEDKSKDENNNEKPVCSSDPATQTVDTNKTRITTEPEEEEIFADTVKLDDSKSLFTDYDEKSSDEDDDDDLKLVDKSS